MVLAIFIIKLINEHKPCLGFYKLYFYITVFLVETNCFHKILDVTFISSYM